jgi:Circularly permutated YpsA SLOG family
MGSLVRGPIEARICWEYQPATSGSFRGYESAAGNKLRKPVLHIYDTRKERIFNEVSLRFEVQALTDFLCSNKIDVLNVAGPRESKEPGVYEWTLTMLRFALNRAVLERGSTEKARE